MKSLFSEIRDDGCGGTDGRLESVRRLPPWGEPKPRKRYSRVHPRNEVASSRIKLLLIKTTNSQHSVSQQFHHAAHGYTLSNAIPDSEFEEKMRQHLSHNSWTYYWNWHKEEPSLPLAQMLDIVEEQREERLKADSEEYLAECRETLADQGLEEDPSLLDDILALLESPVTHSYVPVVRDTFEPTPEDIECIRFYGTLPYADRGTAIKAWEEGWAARTLGLTPTHIHHLASRGLTLRSAHPPEGSDEWRRIVYGPSKDEYDEMDRLGFLGWDESYKANEKRARLFSLAFLSLSYNEQVRCARWYKNAAAWGVFEGLLSEEEERAIRRDVEALDRAEDEMDRLEHTWDD